MPHFDEDMTVEEWAAQEAEIDAENAERDERDHRFAEDIDPHAALYAALAAFVEG